MFCFEYFCNVFCVNLSILQWRMTGKYAVSLKTSNSSSSRRLPVIDVILLANTQDDERGLYIINVILYVT